jgi:streptogramin lyase
MKRSPLRGCLRHLCAAAGAAATRPPTGGARPHCVLQQPGSTAWYIAVQVAGKLDGRQLREPTAMTGCPKR